ncbi:uncharacterized protein [Oscarella lobularis]|uniref:uncharacterized protein n=1 Tax=Oscarella lobularis TaxID=121494 RepID=UPI003313B1FE
MESLEQQSVRRPLARAIFAEMLISTYDEGECPSELQNALQSLRDPEIPLEVGRNLSAVADQFDRTEGLHVDERAQNVSSEELSKYERFKNNVLQLLSPIMSVKTLVWASVALLFAYAVKIVVKRFSTDRGICQTIVHYVTTFFDETMMNRIKEMTWRGLQEFARQYTGTAETSETGETTEPDSRVSTGHPISPHNNSFGMGVTLGVGLGVGLAIGAIGGVVAGILIATQASK